MAKKRIGEILKDMGVIDEMQLASALAHHRQWGMPLAQALVDKRFCTPEQVLSALSKQAGLALFDLDAHALLPALAKVMPQRLAEQYRAVPLRVEGKRGEVLVVAIAAPGSLQSLDSIQAITGKQRVVPYLASDAAIARGLARLYGSDDLQQPPAHGYEEARVVNELELELDGSSSSHATSQPPAPAPAAALTPDPALTPTPTQAPSDVQPIAGLKLSAACMSVLGRAAAHYRVPVARFAEQLLETWASKQKK